MRSERQRQHEEYWGRCWAVALTRRLDADVYWARPDQDPPDSDFLVKHRDGTVMNCWGEVTGAYYSRNDAKWLWGTESNSGGRAYYGPDSHIAESARDSVRSKLQKYEKLVEQQGRGHLLVLLLSPLTTRSTRAKAEHSILKVLDGRPRSNSGPFETIWLGYHLPHTDPQESEDPRHAFLESPDSRRFNFFKCIWIRSITRTQN